MPIIIQQLSHTYLPGSQLAYPALSDISLTIQDGEFLGIIGHTGSGKSTLIQHLNGLLLPTAGSVLVDGLDTREKKIRRKIRSIPTNWTGVTGNRCNTNPSKRDL